jgi:hypothetical protein
VTTEVDADVTETVDEDVEADGEGGDDSVVISEGTAL